MHGRAVLSVCNLRLLDLKQRLMYIKEPRASPARITCRALFVADRTRGACHAGGSCPGHYRPDRKLGADRTCIGVNSALQPLAEKFPVNFLLFTESPNSALLLVVLANLTSPIEGLVEPPTVQLRLGMICDAHLYRLACALRATSGVENVGPPGLPRTPRFTWVTRSA
jgi:hypothetical protein